MKKLFAAAVIILTLLMIATSTMAGSVKPPKNLCLDFNAWSGDFQNLVFNSAGAMDTAAGKIKIYTVTGIAITQYNYFSPISGSAYVQPVSTVLHATYSGKIDMAGPCFLAIELEYDLEYGTGRILYDIEYPNGTFSHVEDTVVQMDCESFALP